jgi:hypothetical protein
VGRDLPHAVIVSSRPGAVPPGSRPAREPSRPGAVPPGPLFAATFLAPSPIAPVVEESFSPAAAVRSLTLSIGVDFGEAGSRTAPPAELPMIVAASSRTASNVAAGS